MKSCYTFALPIGREWPLELLNKKTYMNVYMQQ
jgi:hypothetical protein